jgi:hypothetical protein
MVSDAQIVEKRGEYRSEHGPNDRYPPEELNVIRACGEGLAAPARDEREEAWREVPGRVDGPAVVVAVRERDDGDHQRDEYGVHGDRVLVLFLVVDGVHDHYEEHGAHRRVPQGRADCQLRFRVAREYRRHLHTRKKQRIIKCSLFLRLTRSFSSNSH